MQPSATVMHLFCCSIPLTPILVRWVAVLEGVQVVELVG